MHINPNMVTWFEQQSFQDLQIRIELQKLVKQTLEEKLPGTTSDDLSENDWKQIADTINRLISLGRPVTSSQCMRKFKALVSPLIVIKPSRNTPIPKTSRSVNPVPTNSHTTYDVNNNSNATHRLAFSAQEKVFSKNETDKQVFQIQEIPFTEDMAQDLEFLTVLNDKSDNFKNGTFKWKKIAKILSPKLPEKKDIIGYLRGRFFYLCNHKTKYNQDGDNNSTINGGDDRVGKVFQLLKKARINYTFRPQPRKNSWKPEEDEKLLALKNECLSWNKISDKMQEAFPNGRTYTYENCQYRVGVLQGKKCISDAKNAFRIAKSYIPKA